MIIIIFIILGLLNAVEATTTISRRAGYSIGNAASGLIFQSSLALVSRALIFMFMPILGALSDSNQLLANDLDVLYYYIFIVLFLIIIYFLRYKIESFFGMLLMNINDFGSYFKMSKKRYFVDKTLSNFQRKKGYKFYLVVLFTYVPYYLSWPLIIILLDTYNEDRGLILGLSAIFNGINTIAITLWIDPKLAKFGKYKNHILRTYSDLLLVRVFSSLLGYIILGLIITLI
jgi:hypothetical protein